MDLVSNAVVGRHGRRIEKGSLIFKEGEPSGEIFVVRSGRVRISKQVGREEVCLAVLGKGEFFGEMGMLDSPRSVSAVAESDATVVAIDAKRFAQLVADTPELALRLVNRLGHRLRMVDERLLDLMTRDEPARIGEAIRALAADRSELPDGRVQLDSRATLDWIARQAGVLPSKAQRILDLLEGKGVLGIGADGRMWIASREVLDDLTEYWDLKERFDPLTLEELADLAGLSLSEAQVLAERVIRKRLSLQENAEPELLRTPLQRYLQLKLRFEFSQSAVRPESPFEGSV